MKSSIFYSSLQKTLSEKNDEKSSTTSLRSYVSAKFRTKQKSLPKSSGKTLVKPLVKTSVKSSGKPSTKSFGKPLVKTFVKPFVEKSKSQKEKKKIEKSIVSLPLEKSFPCLFVKSLEKKNEVLGTPLMNRLIRFLTKKGKKSKASVLLTKACTLLGQFEMEKIDGKEISSQSFSNFPKKSKFETYKSQKVSQFLSRKKTKSSQDMDSRYLKKQSFEKMNSENSLQIEFLKRIQFSSRHLIEQAICHVKPFVEVKKVRVAGTTYQVPAILEKHRQENFALKWILQSAFERHKKNPSQPLEYSLAFELYEASKKQGQARMKRNELHKLAEAHRAFAHFRWW